VHPAYLARTFRSHFGTPLGSYARRLRLTWAASQLSSTDDPIARIALEAGFFDQSHFTRAFRQSYGMTPLAYRKAAKE